MAVILGGWFWIWRFAFPMVADAYESLEWPAVTGTITKSELNSFVVDGASSTIRRRGGAPSYRTVYRADISYSYSVEGREYSASVISFAVAGEDLSRGYVSEYSPGKVVSVYYKPANPQVAVLIPGPTWASFTHVFTGGGLSLFGLVLYILLSPARAARRRMKRQTANSIPL